MLHRLRLTNLRVAGALFMLGLSAVAGCGGGPTGKDLPLDQALAKQSLTTVLDAWKAGEKPAAMQNRQPKIVVGDPSWEQGAKLLDYKLLGEKDMGNNLYIHVDLSIERDGSTSAREITYVVGTSPVISVFPEQ